MHRHNQTGTHTIQHKKLPVHTRTHHHRTRGTPMTQWTRQARQYLQNELQKEKHQFKKIIEKNAPIILKQHNTKRQQYGLPPQKRVTKDIIKETIINTIFDDNAGDAERKENNINYDFKGGMYT